jgi:hypothetical protein
MMGEKGERWSQDLMRSMSEVFGVALSISFKILIVSKFHIIRFMNYLFIRSHFILLFYGLLSSVILIHALIVHCN